LKIIFFPIEWSCTLFKNHLTVDVWLYYRTVNLIPVDLHVCP
jgi:hypothetical protein